MTQRPLYISTFCCIDRPLEQALELLSRTTSHVEILSDGPHDLLLYDTPCGDFPLVYSVHAPSSEINIAAVSERIRSASVALLGDMLAASSRIGADHLVVHPGFSPYEQLRERSYRSLLVSLDELARLQAEYGVLVCVENMGAWECCHFRTPAFIPELTSRGLGMTLDCGHARLNGNLDAFLTAGGFCHVHLHDNGGISDDHEACGSGALDYPRILRALSSGTALVVETRELDAAFQSIGYLSPLLSGERS